MQARSDQALDADDVSPRVNTLRLLRVVPALVSALAIGSLGGTDAFGGPKDAAVQKLDDAANDEFLSANFAKAEELLKRALKECRPAKACNPKLAAELHTHLGIVLVNAGKKVAAVKAFSAALDLRADVTPSKEFVTPEVAAAFREAQEQRAQKRGPDDDKRADVAHEPVTESRVDRPIPIFVGNEPSASKFVLRYKPPSGDWKKAPMKRKGKGWGGSIPCRDTRETGTLSYYVLGEDDQGGIAAHAGSKRRPYELEIKEKIAGEPPSFPGEEPPARCSEKEEIDACPAGSTEPGCAAALLGEGAACATSQQCSREDGLSCNEGTCSAVGGAARGGPSRNWVTLGASIDFASVSTGQVCSRDAYTTSKFACFESDGKFYRPSSANDPTTPGGLKFSTTRLVAGYDRIIVGNLAVGIRVGYAFGGGPAVPGPRGDGAFLPWHLEPRATFWIGEDVLSRVGVRPYVFASGGFAQVDTRLPNVVVSNDCELQATCRGPKTPTTPAFNPDGTQKTHADGTPVLITPNGVDVSTLPAKGSSKITVDAYRKMGTSFVALGGGVMLALDKSVGLTLDVKVAYYFGSPGLTVSPTLGGIVGFLARVPARRLNSAADHRQNVGGAAPSRVLHHKRWGLVPEGRK